jgi:hypothetical protein
MAVALFLSSMHEIETQAMSEAFYDCWKAAFMHLNRQVDGGIESWLRNHPYPPFLEHLSFRLGNQLFFVRVDDADGRMRGPGNAHGFVEAAKMANGRACILPMTRRPVDGAWASALPGWGLLDAVTRLPINPVELVTDQEIEMTAWELQDFAVQVVRSYLDAQGFKLMSWQGNPEVDPSIWFIGRSAMPEWVVVRVAKFPANGAPRPENWKSIADACARMSDRGHFASVAIVSAHQPFASAQELPVPLWRGHAMRVRFTGIE